MAKNPFQQFRVLTTVLSQGRNITDCYRLLYKKELWLAPTVIPQSKKLEIEDIDAIIKQLQTRTFRLNIESHDQPTASFLHVLHTILHQIYHPLLKNDPTGKSTFNVLNGWKGLNCCMVGDVPTHKNTLFSTFILKKYIHDDRFIKLLLQVIAYTYVNSSIKGIHRAISQLVCQIVQYHLDCFIKMQMKQIELANTSLHGRVPQAQMLLVDQQVIIGHSQKYTMMQLFDRLACLPGVKFKIHTLDKPVPFLQYEIRREKGANTLGCYIPKRVLSQYARELGYGDFYRFVPTHRRSLLYLSEEELLERYNKELMAIWLRFSAAKNQPLLRKFYDLAKHSLLMTIAYKRKTTVKKTVMKLKSPKQGALLFVKGKQRVEFIPYLDLKNK